MTCTLTWLIWGGRSGELWGNTTRILNRCFSSEKQTNKILLFWCLWQHFAGQLLKKTVQTTELKNTLVRRKDFGLIWNEMHILFLNETTHSHCQVCTGLNETFHLWVFLPSLKNDSIELTFEARCCSKIKSQFLFVKHWHKMSHPLWKISFSLCCPLALSPLLLDFDWSYFIQIHSFAQMFRSPINCIFQRVKWNVSPPLPSTYWCSAGCSRSSSLEILMLLGFWWGSENWLLYWRNLHWHLEIPNKTEDFTNGEGKKNQ